MLSELSTYLRYTSALPGFLRTRQTLPGAEQLLQASLARREERFLRVVERGIFGHAESPYLPLLRHAGVELGDVRSLVADAGLEGALERLYDAGVRVTADEMKGRRPIERPGVHVPASTTAFDNPLLTRHYEARSSGSRGPRTRANIDLELLAHEAAYVAVYLDAFGIRDRPYAVWRPVPPVASGVKWLLRLERTGKPLDRWFSHTPLELRHGGSRFALFTASTVAEGRLLGRRFPWPTHVPGDSPAPVTAWLAEMARRGTPATLDTMVSSAVRICIDANARGVDISGTLFRLGGEPLTEAKARAVSEAGCRALCFYSTTETSFLGAPCAAAEERDDVHLLTDKVAVVTREKATGAGTVAALVVTTLLPSSPKLMLNVETGDFGIVSERRCGCPFGRLGFTHHLSGIRSYEKLTSEGVTFLGTELLHLLEQDLPRAFGGGPTDYQLVEEETMDGLSRVSVVVSPRLGPLDTTAVVDRILTELARYPGGRAMTDQWARGGTIRVRRREPLRTPSGKILPLHVQRFGDSAVGPSE